jgi:hypothetical protein
VNTGTQNKRGTVTKKVPSPCSQIFTGDNLVLTIYGLNLKSMKKYVPRSAAALIDRAAVEGP